MASAEEAVAGALLGMTDSTVQEECSGNAARSEEVADSTQTGGAATPIQPDMVFLTQRQLSARAIQHGCSEASSNLKKWAGSASSKPGLKELRELIFKFCVD